MQLSPKEQAQDWRTLKRLHKDQMITGPYLLDSHTVIVPSNWYNKTAAQCWKANGFVWNGGCNVWKRDTRRPARDGQRYSASAWLNWCRRKYYDEFWPELKKVCAICRRHFVPASAYDIMCPQCQDADIN